MKWKIKRFNELSADELHDVLQLRSDVFIVEQNCVYPDIDGKDRKALHVIGELEGNIIGYARLFKPGDYFQNASIGRVVVAREFRNRAFGHDLMREAIVGIRRHFGETKITISAQLYLRNFYEEHQFAAIGEPYLEDDIPHIEMLRDVD
ncbi:MAG: GNAT family N-acetyltransferase [Flavobacterium sp.]|nr:MAG: GNAT family N-acetyltransferase [Flavobacterium sp.]